MPSFALVVLACALLLNAAPVSAQEALSQLRAVAGDAAVEEAQSEVPEVGPVDVLELTVLEFPGGVRVRGTDPIAWNREPDASVVLDEIFSRHWTADSYPSGDKPTYLSITYDRVGDPYLSVLAPGWETPRFYKFEGGMKGEWEAGGETYKLSLSVNIFRRRTANYIVIKKEGEKDPVYQKRIEELGDMAFAVGREVIVSGEAYRLFFSYGIKGESTAVVDPDTFGFVLIYDKGKKYKGVFPTFIIPYDDLGGGRTVRYELYKKQEVGLRLSPGGGSLEIYDLSTPKTAS
ncbi:MAG: hypothetical protein ABII00_16250 [Elusimicrobiota bacterium]